MRVGMLAPIAWRTPPEHYGPWEWVVSQLTEGLVQRGVDVTLFATGNSHTAGRLEWVCPRPYEEDPELDPKVWEGLHISHFFQQAHRFDLLHNHFDFLPLTYSPFVATPLLTTIHGFSSERILPVYQAFNRRTHYVAISDADRRPELEYVATIHHGIPVQDYRFYPEAGAYLLVFGRIHHDKGVHEAIQVARAVDLPLVIAGIIQDRNYFEQKVEPYLDGERVRYIGSVGPDRKSEVLGRALALLHLINFDEPFGLSVVEALACGVPVVAVRRGAMPEILVHGETGFLVRNSEEAIQACRRLPEIDRRRCRARVEAHFTVERMVTQYLEVYEKILTEKGRRA